MTTSLHVADVTLFFAPHSGGVKRYLLAKRAFFATRPELRHSLLVPGAHTREREPGFHELASTAIPRGGGYRVPLRRRAWAQRLADLSPDLIEVGDPYHLAWTALAAAERLGVPAVAFAHSDLARLLGDRFAPAIGRAAGLYLRTLYRRFDAVFAPSRLVAERLGDLGIGNVCVQPLGVDGELFHPRQADRTLRKQLGLAADTRLLVFAGRLAREKEVPLLVRAFAELGAPYHLLLVGGPHASRLAANVSLLPYQQDAAALARLLASCDALVHAGRHETFGLIVLEAMACGLPVVAVRAGAVTELVHRDVGLLAEPDDARALAGAVRALYAADRVAMGRNARARVEREYAWTQTLSRQVRRYAELVRARAPQPCESAAGETAAPGA